VEFSVHDGCTRSIPWGATTFLATSPLHRHIDMLLVAATATSGALLQRPPALTSDILSRRTVLQQLAGGALAVAAAPGSAFAADAPPRTAEELFEAIRKAAEASFLTENQRTSKFGSVFSNEFSKLSLVPSKKNFIYEAPGLCPYVPGSSGNRFLTVRLWKPVGKTGAQEIVTAFGTGLAPGKVQYPDGFKYYYGSVVKDVNGNELALFANNFATSEGRDTFSKLAVDFAQENLQGKATLVEKTAGVTPEPASYYVC
jgi:hypothetical protein